MSEISSIGERVDGMVPCDRSFDMLAKAITYKVAHDVRFKSFLAACLSGDKKETAVLRDALASEGCLVIFDKLRIEDLTDRKTYQTFVSDTLKDMLDAVMVRDVATEADEITAFEERGEFLADGLKKFHAGRQIDRLMGDKPVERKHPQPLSQERLREAGGFKPFFVPD